MSVLDRQILFSNAQAITASAASTDVIDLGSVQDTCKNRSQGPGGNLRPPERLRKWLIPDLCPGQLACRNPIRHEEGHIFVQEGSPSWTRTGKPQVLGRTGIF